GSVAHERRATLVVGDRDLGREERAVPLGPERGAHGVLRRDAAEQARALAARVPRLVQLTLDAVQVSPRDELARRAVAPPLVDDGEAVWSHRREQPALRFERHLEQVRVALEPTID